MLDQERQPAWSARSSSRPAAWRLDRWERFLVDLVTTPRELTGLDVGFVSSSEGLDMTTPSGRALAGMPAVFARMAAAWAALTAAKLNPERKRPRKEGPSKRAIAKELGIRRTSVILLLRSTRRS